MQNQVQNIVLAEDDEDDSFFFEEALKSVASSPSFIRAKDGVELTDLLKELPSPPDLLFLDLNMPRKNGAQCLSEIRNQMELQHLPIVVLSTNSSASIIDEMYNSGANLYVQKPNDVRSWKRVIAKVLNLDWNIQTPFSVKKNFMLIDF